MCQNSLVLAPRSLVVGEAPASKLQAYNIPHTLIPNTALHYIAHSHLYRYARYIGSIRRLKKLVTT